MDTVGTLSLANELSEYLAAHMHTVRTAHTVCTVCEVLSHWLRSDGIGKHHLITF